MWPALGTLDDHTVRVLHRLRDCRTAAMGTHWCVCAACGWRGAVHNACRDRHCARCQRRGTADWERAQARRMLPVPHFQVVFTLPSTLRPLARAHPKPVYSLLMRTAARVLQELAAEHLGVRLGITAVLHTWTTTLTYHPHVHLLVTAGGLHLQEPRWVGVRGDYLLPQRKLGACFRGALLRALGEALPEMELPDDEARHWRDGLRAAARRNRRGWVVHVEAPQGRPAAPIRRYLARYVKRVAIDDARIQCATDTHVTFGARTGPCTLPIVEFLRRFAQHVLPKGFHKVRHLGLYAPGASASRAVARAAIAELTGVPVVEEPAADEEPERCRRCGVDALWHLFPGRTLPPGWLRAHEVRRARGPP